jgi:hypothetical protein
MSLEVINGYVCRNCTDVELAKKGVDPAHPKDDPKNPAYDPAKAKADHGPAFKLDGALAKSGVDGSATNALPPVNGASGADGSNSTSPTASDGRGAYLNVAA